MAHMFIGHYAVGLASKKFAPQASLGALMAAPILLDLIWPIFVLLGWEHVSIEPNANPFLRLAFDAYPISHGLVAVVGWATLFAALYFGIARYATGAIVIWIGVVSHWLLDYVVHRPDLPLYAGSRQFGLSLLSHVGRDISIRGHAFNRDLHELSQTDLGGQSLSRAGARQFQDRKAPGMDSRARSAGLCLFQSLDSCEQRRRLLDLSRPHRSDAGSVAG